MTDQPSTTNPSPDQPQRTDQPPTADQRSKAEPSTTDDSHGLGAAFWIKGVLLLMLLYPLAVGPLAFLRGAGLMDEKTVDVIRPIYAPLRNTPVVWLLAGYEQKADALGRRFHK